MLTTLFQMQVASTSFYLKTLPLFDGGDDVGMVLSPQCFHNLNLHADIFNHSNVHFWEYMQPGAGLPRPKLDTLSGSKMCDSHLLGVDTTAVSCMTAICGCRCRHVGREKTVAYGYFPSWQWHAKSCARRL